MNEEDFKAAGMVETAVGWVRTSDDKLGHTRHTTLCYRDGSWWCAGLGIAGPKNRDELLLLTRILFG